MEKSMSVGAEKGAADKAVSDGAKKAGIINLAGKQISRRTGGCTNGSGGGIASE